MANPSKKAAGFIAVIIAVIVVFGVVAMLLNRRAVPQSAKVSSSSSADETEILKKYPDTKLYSLSHDRRKMAIARLIKKSGIPVAEVDIYSVGEKKLTNVEVITADCSTFAWSYNDKFLAADARSGEGGITYIIDASLNQLKLKIGDAGYLWSTDNDYLATATLDDTIKPEGETDFTEATGVTVFNIDTLQKHIVLTASKTYLYKPMALNSKSLTVKRIPFADNSVSTISFKLPKI